MCGPHTNPPQLYFWFSVSCIVFREFEVISIMTTLSTFIYQSAATWHFSSFKAAVYQTLLI